MTPYQLYQLEKYGDFIPDGTPETENGAQARSEADAWCEKEGERQLMEDEQN